MSVPVEPGEVFTPIRAGTDERLRFAMADVTVLRGSVNERGAGYKATVRIKGAEYDVYGISCGLDNCMCDAEIRPVPAVPAIRQGEATAEDALRIVTEAQHDLAKCYWTAKHQGAEADRQGNLAYAIEAYATAAAYALSVGQLQVQLAPRERWARLARECTMLARRVAARLDRAPARKKG